MIAALALAVLVAAAGPAVANAPQAAPPPEVIADIQLRGNVVTTDEEMRRLAGVTVGEPVGAATLNEVAARLRATKRFERVDVLKRFASIADPSQIVLVIIVDEGPVAMERTDDPEQPVRVAKKHGAPMFLPVLRYEDGYGFTYGIRLATPLAKDTRVSFPLTWGGDKSAAAEIERDFDHRRTAVSGGISFNRREHPYFDQDEDRGRVWAHADRELVPLLRAGVTGGWQHVSFLGADDRVAHGGVDATFDNRLDPLTARNAVYARAAWQHFTFDTHDPVSQWTLDGRGYIGLFGGSVLVVRGRRDDASGPMPPYLQPILGGTPTVRGFSLGVAVGDRLVAGSTELRVPLTSPLKIARLGVSAFVDAGTVYSHDQHYGDEPIRKGAGGGVWMSIAFIHFELAVAHGIGASTRVHFEGGASF